MAKRKDQREFRVYVPEEVHRLLQSIAAIRDVSVNAVVNDAIDLWLSDEKQQQTIEKHNLEELD